jgi:uncharacterized protein
MDLSLQQPGDHLFIRATSQQGIRVVNDWYGGSLILSADQLIHPWEAGTVDELSERNLKPIFEFEADIVLIGTGRKQHFLPAEIMMQFYQRGLGAEVMSTDAACRTFNVLVSEQRRVVAALFPLQA